MQTQKVENEEIKKENNKKLFKNNFTIRDTNNSTSKATYSITQQFFTPKTNSKEDMPLNIE